MTTTRHVARAVAVTAAAAPQWSVAVRGEREQHLGICSRGLHVVGPADSSPHASWSSLYPELHRCATVSAGLDAVSRADHEPKSGRR